MSVPRRLVFGSVAELYDRRRPSYPGELLDDLLAMAGVRAGDRVLEVGAGTGIVTRLLASRRVGVIAIEPDAEMALVARRTLANASGVTVVDSDFEAWDPAGERFALLVSGQAWHWVDASVGYERARAALREGGLLAPFWNRPAWRDSEIRRTLSALYRRVAPGMPADGPLHPDNQTEPSEADWTATIDDVPSFAEPQMRNYEWSIDYSAVEYTELLDTLSEVRLLDERVRDRLLAGVRDAIDEHGGTLTMPMVTFAGLARAI